MIVIKKCIECNKKFKSHFLKKRKYCSANCFNIARMLNLTKICIECRKPFRVKSNFKKKKFCSHECYGKSKKGMLSPMKGKKHTLITRKKMSKKVRKAFKNIINHPRYKFGRYINEKGYMMLPTSEWVISKRSGKRQRVYRLEHRLVMEKILNRPLKNYELVHHINGIKTDNRPENLTILTNSNHYSEISCPFCNKKFLMK